MSSVRAATTLALWGAAFQGGCNADDVLTALDGTGYRAGVRAASEEVAEATGLPGPGSSSAGSAALLPLLRPGPVELLMPTPGDLRGLPVRGAVVLPALDAGAVVVLPGRGIGLVPVDGQWRAHFCPGGNPVPSLRQAQWELTEAMELATAELTRLDVARSAPEVREQIRQLMLAEAVDCPPGTPAAASALLAKAISLQAVLAVADGHETSAVNNFELAAVDDALRPLGSAVRHGRRAAVGAAVAQLTGSGVGSRS
ncbi:hypothetical protein [Nakamurella leprariae]|uniref:Uncharacterized protein n=1 Tax=Nakamurella leprariae TaxID=2803911 RepID=A0A938YDH0_9ACTN|nr:hypothetical protein [Nakamurella leprariae]MBM9466169.1 hypothetical protein [Nakamurella leprariae]